MDSRRISVWACFCLLSIAPGCAVGDAAGSATDTDTESDGGGTSSGEGGTQTDTSGDGDTTTSGDGTTGDGDGTTGDGDGTTGDGTTGDGTTGDGTTGDGDGTTGDGTTGDGDGTTGDGTTGDGDGCMVGESGCPCFPNNSCFSPLVCANGTCGDGDGDGDGTTAYGPCPSGNDSECAVGETCVLGTSQQGQDWSFCTPGPCQSDADCTSAAGDFCANLPGDGQAVDYCVSFECTNMPCPNGMYCGTGFFNEDVCVWPDGGDGDGDGDGDGTTTGGLLPDGDPCTQNSECQGGFCYPEFGGGGTVNTVCFSTCSMDTGGFPPPACDDNADCCAGSCQPSGFGGVDTCQ